MKYLSVGYATQPKPIDLDQKETMGANSTNKYPSIVSVHFSKNKSTVFRLA